MYQTNQILDTNKTHKKRDHVAPNICDQKYSKTTQTYLKQAYTNGIKEILLNHVSKEKQTLILV